MKFQYSQFSVSGSRMVYRPMLEIVLKANKRFIYTHAVIDSGADCCIYPKDLADDLGITLDPKNKEEFFGAGGKKFVVFPSPVKIEHLIRKNGFRSIVWQNSKVYFANNHNIALLGMSGFLDKFRVVLNGCDKEFEIFVK